MEEIKINKFQSVYYILWDNNDSTLDDLSEYFKLTRRPNWSCGRCYKDHTNGILSDTLYIAFKENGGCSAIYFELGEYIIFDKGNEDFPLGLNKEEFDKYLVD